jgi:hypothetical protein
MIDAYLEEVRACTTINLVNRIHIRLENRLNPAEMCAIIDGLSGGNVSLPAPAANWLARTDRQLRGNGRPLQGYVRHELSERAVLHAAPGGEEARAGRTLVIAFTGDARRLMMPLALFLQHCPADRYEFLVLYDRKRAFYLGGVEGLGEDLPSTIDAIAARVDPRRYRRAVSFGTSAGGLAALWTGVALGLDRAVSVGGTTSENAAEREQTETVDTSGFEEAIRRRAGKLPEVVLVSGAENERDVAKAQAMLARLPATTILVPGCADHNVLYKVWERGGLDELLERLLGEAQA